MSLRTRLAVAYGTVTACVLITLAILATRLLFAVLSEPVLDAVTRAERTAHLIVAQYAGTDRRTIQAAIKARVSGGGVVVLLPPPDALLPPRINPRPFGGGPELLSFRPFLGLGERTVVLPDGSDVHLAPNLMLLRTSLTIYAVALIASIVLAIALSIVAGRWLAAQAISPLVTVTAELRRFAAGDFSKRAVTTADRSELGELTAAYNGAAQQVLAAFAERTSAEAQMRRFVADAGHELRTPLTVVTGFLDVLQRGGVDDPQIRERAFATLRTETVRMRKLVERLIVLARLESSDSAAPREPVDVAEIAQGAVDQIRSAQSGTVTLDVRAAETTVLADRGDLHEAIANLVDNAVKYGNGSDVGLLVENDAQHVTVRVRDRGPGIADADRARLFERFYRGTTADGTDGSGLGLAIAKHAAARCGGTLHLETSGPAGSTFTLTFPVLTQLPEAAQPLRFR